ncbi:MAG: helix-turn-helix domain-containing protein [Clostridia bacterium]|nr:helix-turn-helix domain-containing protein [Clostridia bacterium]
MTEFGTRLRDLRICHNMTQDEAATAINVTKQAISKWENDRGLPDVSSLGALAELYSVSIDYLLTGSEIEKEVEVVEKEKIVEVEKPLTEEMIKALQLRNFDAFRMSYGAIFAGVMSTIIAISFLIIVCRIPHNVPINGPYILLLVMMMAFIILAIVAYYLGFKRIRKYKEVKKEVEEKTGMEIGIYYFKKDKNIDKK